MLAALYYSFVYSFCRDQLGTAHQSDLPLFAEMFLLFFVYNFIGLLPFQMTFSGQLYLVFAYTFIVFATFNYRAARRYGLHVFEYFYHDDLPF
jgi:F0F1-type ATP synthase membrane subunit a